MTTRKVWLLTFVLGCGGQDVVELPPSDAILIENLARAFTGVTFRAFTLPNGTIVTLGSADDPCLLAHEREHMRQINTAGGVVHAGTYKLEMAVCLGRYRVDTWRNHFGGCYWNVTAEVEARKVQETCEATQIPETAK